MADQLNAALEKKISKVEAQKRIEKEREKDYEMVTGIFECKEPGKTKLEFRFKKYPGEEFKLYTLHSGKPYRLPRMVARHLNSGIYYVEYKRLNLPNGMATDVHMGGVADDHSPESRMYAQTKIKRTEFKSLEFMEDDLNTKEIVEITYR